MKSPNRMLAGDEGAKSLAGRVPSKRPVRGPTQRMATRPLMAPRRWTGPLPAKSWAPKLPSQPVSDQTQWATKA
eukprot:Skav218113  [mRNA]  locus=scaffold759:221940:222485:+ [translate_table: standard]